MIIRYDPEGIAIPDIKAESYIKELINKEKSGEIVKVRVSTENVIHAARTLIAENFVDHNKIIFEFKNDTLHPNRYGKLEYWPEDFADTIGKFLVRLVKATVKHVGKMEG